SAVRGWAGASLPPLPAGGGHQLAPGVFHQEGGGGDVMNKALRCIMSVLRHLVLYGLFLLFLAPFLLVLTNSFKSRREILSNPFGLPSTWSLSNFVTAYRSMGFAPAFMNSLLITVLSAIGIAVLSAMTAYLFARTD